MKPDWQTLPTHTEHAQPAAEDKAAAKALIQKIDQARNTPMNTPKHTPGPWEHNGNAVHKRISAHYATCVCVCEGEERYANAALISSAPELLAALEDVMSDHASKIACCNPSLSERCFAAIARAKGEQP